MKSPQRGESHSRSRSSFWAHAAAITPSATEGPSASAQTATPERSGENAKYEHAPERTTAAITNAERKEGAREGDGEDEDSGMVRRRA